MIPEGQINNWPREGEHNTVTADHLARLESLAARTQTMRNDGHAELDRIAGSALRTSEQAARTYEHNRGHRILHQASHDMREAREQALEPAVLEMELIKQQAREHLQGEFQSQSQVQRP